MRSGFGNKAVSTKTKDSSDRRFKLLREFRAYVFVFVRKLQNVNSLAFDHARELRHKLRLVLLLHYENHVGPTGILVGSGYLKLIALG